MNYRNERHDIFSSFDSVIEGLELLKSYLNLEACDNEEEVKDLINQISMQAMKGKDIFNKITSKGSDIL